MLGIKSLVADLPQKSQDVFQGHLKMNIKVTVCPFFAHSNFFSNIAIATISDQIQIFIVLRLQKL